MFLAISFLFSIALFVVGVLTLLRSSKNAINLSFFFMSIFCSLWSLTYSIIEVPQSLELVSALNKLSYALGVLILFTSVTFTYVYPKRKNLKSLRYFGYLTVFTLLLCFSDLLAGSVIVQDGEFVFEYGPLILVYLFTFVVGIVLLIRNFYASKNYSQERDSIKVLVAGYIASLIAGIIFAIVLPSIFPGSRIDDLAPLSLVSLIITTNYAIRKYKLFDLRYALVKGLAYVLTFGLVVLVYVFSVTFLKDVIVDDSITENEQLVLSTIITIILVLLYPSLKKGIDKISNKIFFQDAYDPQQFIEQLNRTLVSDVNVESLLKKTSQIIEENIRSEFCTFYLRGTSYFDSRLIGDIGALNSELNDRQLESILGLASKVRKKVILTDAEAVGDLEHEVIGMLKKTKIEVLVRLVSTLEYDVAGVGNLFIGPKKSGRVYTAKDAKVIEIIANELVIAIENSLKFEEIEQFNVTLQKKIDEATRELKASNDKLKALDEAKDEFVSMASHQLRTPLTSIKGYISMVLDGDAGKINDPQKQMLGQALFSSQRMVYLISDLLNVSRLKTGKFAIDTKPVYMPDLVESELSQLYEGALAKNITLSFKKPAHFPTLQLDDMKIRQVVMNFTDNALYYTPNNGKITVELKEKHDSVEFTVKDNGIGVPTQERHKLFAKFYRAENARKARPDGTGLGLFMAKKVVVAQGGSIIFASKEGKGSTFGFSFPKPKEPKEKA